MSGHAARSANCKSLIRLASEVNSAALELLFAFVGFEHTLTYGLRDAYIIQVSTFIFVLVAKAQIVIAMSI